MNLKATSIPYTTKAVIKVATITITALPCNSFQAGQETFVTNSLYVSFMYALTLFILPYYMHGRRDSNSHQRFWRPLFYP